jgi:hypothetical protein
MNGILVIKTNGTSDDKEKKSDKRWERKAEGMLWERGRATQRGCAPPREPPMAARRSSIGRRRAPIGHGRHARAGPAGSEIGHTTSAGAGQHRIKLAISTGGAIPAAAANPRAGLESELMLTQKRYESRPRNYPRCSLAALRWFYHT